MREKGGHAEVVEKVYALSENLGFGVCGLDFSPVKGPEGNIEYLIFLKKGAESSVPIGRTAEVVEASHAELD